MSSSADASTPLAEFSISNIKSQIDELTKKVEELTLALDQKVDEQNFGNHILQKKSFLNDMLTAVPKLKKSNQYDLSGYLDYWIPFKKVLKEFKFNAFIDAVESNDGSFTIDDESREKELIKMIRKSVDTSYHSIIDLNKIRPVPLSAIKIMLKIKKRAIWADPTQEDFKRDFAKLKFGFNIYDIDDFLLKVYRLVFQMKSTEIAISESYIAGILFSNLDKKYAAFTKRTQEANFGTPNSYGYFKTLADFENGLETEYNILKSKGLLGGNKSKSSKNKQKKIGKNHEVQIKV